MNFLRLMGRILERSGMLLCSAGRKLSPVSFCSRPKSSQQEIFDRWFADEGDKTLRLDYDLDDNSLVLDIGGYEGQWTSDIFLRYGCFIHIFEPVPAFAANISRRIGANKKIVLHRLGLGKTTRSEVISICDNSSSTFKRGLNSTEIKIVNAEEFFRCENIKSVSLLKINIEGGEYELLEHLIETGTVANVQNIQIQFHDFVPNAESRMLAIQATLSVTHELTWQYRFVWENWQLRDVVESSNSKYSL